MRKIKRERKLLPSWDMPSDPVKAVFWFMQWSLQVLVRFFWILVLVGVIIEVIINGKAGGVFQGIISGIIILLVGLGVWAGLGVVLLFFNFSKSITSTLSEVSRMQQSSPPRRPNYRYTEPDAESRIVEGTVTDLDEERKKRRRE